MAIGHLEAALPDESAGQEQQNEVGLHIRTAMATEVSCCGILCCWAAGW